MATIIVFADDTSLRLDAALSQGHERSAEITQHPVEQGADVTDHVRGKPHGLSVQGFIARFPVLSPEEHPEEDRVSQAFQRLEQAVDRGERVDVQTDLKVYRSMVITGLSVTREAGNGHDLEVKLDFQEIRLATAQIAEVPKDALGKAPPATPPQEAARAKSKTQDQAAPLKARGQKQAPPPTPRQRQSAEAVQRRAQPKSLLKGGLEGAWKLIGQGG